MSDRSATPLVAIITGSTSDLPIVDKAKKALDGLSIPHEVRVMSAHRTPDLVTQYVRSAKQRGVRVIIACAGMAAHLAGAVAANTLLPVIGVPIASGPLNGMDALLSTVQMPPGIPVATVGVNGAKNAAILAARILALGDSGIESALEKALETERQAYTDQGPES
ncbi:MAG: 5-(carboxyamino)imidazole ribonucleotide mutase [Deltaproteobacteria bacterium]|nr:5-(carboxyamino)imidazole ribonucleotide mutase [Deltaproteobacteria bacterium]